MTETPVDLIGIGRLIEAFDAVLDEVGPDHRAVPPRHERPVPAESPVDLGLCYSNADGSPSCIIGYALDKLGLPRPAHGTPENNMGIAVLVVFDRFTFHAQTMLERAQDRQDFGDTWAEAVEYAKFGRVV